MAVMACQKSLNVSPAFVQSIFNVNIPGCYMSLSIGYQALYCRAVVVVEVQQVKNRIFGCWVIRASSMVTIFILQSSIRIPCVLRS